MMRHSSEDGEWWRPYFGFRSPQMRWGRCYVVAMELRKARRALFIFKGKDRGDEFCSGMLQIVLSQKLQTW